MVRGKYSQETKIWVDIIMTGHCLTQVKIIGSFHTRATKNSGRVTKYENYETNSIVRSSFSTKTERKNQNSISGLAKKISEHNIHNFSNVVQNLIPLVERYLISLTAFYILKQTPVIGSLPQITCFRNH